MKVKNQWIVFHINCDKLLVETENGKHYIQHQNSFEEISSEKVKLLINS